jgi:hypothetical protein
MRVYVDDRSNSEPRVSVIERSSDIEPEEVAALLGELRCLNDDPGLNPETRARRETDFIDRKRSVLARIEDNEGPAVRTPLTDWSPLFSVPWGDTGPGSLDLADCILCDLFAEPPSRALAMRFRDEVVARLPRDGFELTGPEVTAWYHNALELSTPTPAQAVGAAPLPPEAPLEAANASVLVAACEEAWAAIQARHPDVPDAVIVLGTGVERGRLVKLGHWWGGRWLADGNIRGEVLLAGEALHLPAAEVFEVLLHEAAHGLNAARGIRDTSRGGRYHNQRFRMTAAALGLRVEQMRPYGWARTTLTLAAAEDYAAQIASVGQAMRITRQLESGVRLGAGQDRSGDGSEVDGGRGPEGGGRTRNGVGAACGCGRRMRIAPSVLARGPVLCGLCGAEFSTGRSLERSAGTQGLAVVDDSFVERRRRALSAGKGVVGSDTTTAVRTVTAGSSAVALAAAGDVLADVVEKGMLESWREVWGTEDEILLSGGTAAEVDRLNQLARDCLRRDGTVHGHSVAVGGLDLASGDRVVVGSDCVAWPDGGEPVPEGVVGVVEGVGADWVEIDFAITGRVRFTTSHLGPDSLGYGYAVHESDVVGGLDVSTLRLVPARMSAPVEVAAELSCGAEVEP